jgi:uncharacterized protein with HEPN domain
MPPRTDAAVLLDIDVAARRALEFVRDMGLIEFQADLRTQSAVQHQLLIIGEAAKRLSPDARLRCEDIAWSAMARMRDRLIHGYETVDPVVIWDTVMWKLPPLLASIAPHLPKRDDG